MAGRCRDIKQPDLWDLHAFSENLAPSGIKHTVTNNWAIRDPYSITEGILSIILVGDLLLTVFGCHSA